MLRINNLSFSYKTEKTFNNFNLHIPYNKMISIAGPNKSGKTTLFNLILGKLNNKDSVVLNHKYTTKNYLNKLPREIGLYQSDIKNMFVKDTVYDELRFVLENINEYEELIHNKIITVVEQLDELDLLNKQTKNLTSTEINKVKLLLSVIHNPNVILLDNPFTSLSYKDKEKFLNYFKDINKTIIIFTNNLEDTINSDYIYILHKYKIALEGSPLSVYKEDLLLNRIGLKIPFMVELSQKLMFYEILDKVYFDIEELVNVLWK